MAIIQSGATSSLWTIDSTSNAGRVTVYDQNGNPMSDVSSLANILNALNDAVTIVLGGQATLGVNVGSTSGTLTLTFEGTIDNSTWVAISATPMAGGSTVTTTTANGQWILSTSGLYAVRARISSFSSGSMTVSAVVTPNTSTMNAQSVSVSGAIPTGANVIGITQGYVQIPAAATLGALNAQQAIQVVDGNTLQIQITSATGTHTLAYEASTDSTNGTNGTWEPLFANTKITATAFMPFLMQVGPISINPGIPGTPDDGQWSTSVAGYTWARVRVSAYTNGSSVINLVLSPAERPESVIVSPSVITSPLNWLNQNVVQSYACPTPYQTLRVSDEPSNLFFDNFVNQVIDTNFRWTTPIVSGAGSSISQGTQGTLTVTSGTVASSNAELSSQFSFQSIGAGFLSISLSVTVEAGSFSTGLHRFWGIGTKPSSGYTALNPIQDGIGIEINTAGVMQAVIYTDGSQVFAQSLAGQGTNFGIPTEYTILYKTGLIAYFFINSNEAPIAFASSAFGISLPAFQGLPAYFHSINGTSTLGGAAPFTVNSCTVSDTAGNQSPHTITGPQTSDQANPFAATVFAAGELRTQVEPSTLFVDTFEGTSLDTTVRWNAPIDSGGAPAVGYASGQLTLNTGTTANGYNLLQSQTSFPQVYPGFVQNTFNIQIENPVNSNAYRFWGFGTFPASVTATTPLTDAVGFEIGTTGKLFAVTFAGGTRSAVQDLSKATGNNRQPADGNLHAYIVFFRDDKIYWAIDLLDNIVATFTPLKTGLLGPNHSTLPIIALAIAGSTPPGSNTTVVIESSYVADTSHTNHTLSDGTYGWRKATVKPAYQYSSTSITTDTVLLAQINGVDGGKISRPSRSSEFGTLRTTSEIMLWHDAFEGSTVNAFWTQSTTTQTIAQATGILTLNNSGITTLNTDAIITSQRQFPKYPRHPLFIRFRALISANVASNHTLVEMGLGAPSGVTAIINNGAFFRWTAAGNLNAVLSYNGTEQSTQVLAQGIIATTSYYFYDVIIDDDYARFLVTDANGIPVVDTQIQQTLTVPFLTSVSHLPSFARTYVDATGGGTVVKLNIASHSVQMLDSLTFKPWEQQMSSCMRQAVINPTTYAQTTSSMTAAPATETPSNTAGGYNALGGDYATIVTAASENPLSVFAFQIPSPYSFYLQTLTFSVPFLTAAINVTGAPILEWVAVANCTSANISTGGGQKFPLGIMHAYTTGTQGTGTFLSTGGLAASPQSVQQVWGPKVPVMCLPGTFLHIGYKVFNVSAVATGGITRGSISVDGFFE